MDPAQVRAEIEMKMTRERIDRKLDRLEARLAESRGQLTRIARGAGALVATLYGLASRRRAQR